MGTRRWGLLHFRSSSTTGLTRNAKVYGHREGNQCEETSLIEPGAVATELTVHITDLAAKQGAERLYAQLAITAADVADVIAFAVARPRRMTLNEILLRPTSQPG
jgi:NADP-dependent 3-hydroxy acid dehydrogenase YdfG